jgi:flavin-dependent dehydrogenase
MSDVVVVGGGPAGCAFAVVAARCGHSVTLLDQGRRLKSWPGESIPSGGGEVITSVFGAHVLAGHTRAFGTAAAWGSTELVSHDFMAHWAGHGWHLDRARFDATVREIAAASGVKVVTERLTSLTRAASEWCVNDRWHGDWVIDATGRAGAVVSRLGVSRIRLDEQIALIGVVPDLGGERVTTVESVREGWWYTTPLSGGRRVVALITDPATAVGDRSRTWCRLLSETSHIAAIAAVDRAPQVYAYPADTARRAHIVGDGWMAIGDAAVSFDPLSSQGLITGMVMAARAGALLGGGSWERDYRAVLEEHEVNRAALYAAETRWPDAPFWASRQRYVSGRTA